MKGFLTLAQNSKYDYVRMAYTLAMSLKFSQKKVNKLSVIVNENSEIPDKYIPWFDKIILVEDQKEDWKVGNKWKYYKLTPYDETIVLDTDMLFFHDIGTWWNSLLNYDINFTTRVRNYRNEIATSDFYRKVFTNNKLPNLYTALFYFKKTPNIEQFFNFLGIVFRNWKEFYEKFLREPPKFLSGDVAFSLAAKLYFNKEWSGFSDILTFTHMRSRLQDEDVFDWMKTLPTFFTVIDNRIDLKINNFNQLWPFHYIKKNFLTDEVIELYEKSTIHLL